MVVFKGKLYASYWNDSTVAYIYALDPVPNTWSIVYTGSLLATVHPLTLQVDNGVLYAFGTRAGLSVAPTFLWSTDGVTFTNASTNFPFVNGGFSLPILFGINQT